MATTTEKLKLTTEFFGGMRRSLQSKVRASLLICEELEIFEDRNSIRPAQIMSADTFPASTQGPYSYVQNVRPSDVLYAYGGQAGNIRLLSKASAGADAPAAWATLKDVTQAADARSPIEYHETTESGATVNAVYYLSRSGDTWTLRRYNIGADTEASVGTLTGMVNSFARPWMKRLHGELFIGHGQFIAKVDKNGTFTEKAFTIPNGWEGKSMEGYSDVGIILCQAANRLSNLVAAYMWDLSRTTQFEDYGYIQHGGPQWVRFHRGVILAMTAINGIAKWWQLASTDPLTFQALPDMQLSNIYAETSTQAVCPDKAASPKDGTLYFGIAKTDRSGIYGLGKIDETEPIALALMKRFIPSSTSSYANHRPTGLLVHGPNFYAAFDDNGTASASKCEGNNSPNRSSDAVLRTVFEDDGKPMNNKQAKAIFIATQALPASTSIAAALAVNGSTTYNSVTRQDTSAYNTANAVKDALDSFSGDAADMVAYSIQLSFTSSGTNAPQLLAVGLRFSIEPLAI